MLRLPAFLVATAMALPAGSAAAGPASSGVGRVQRDHLVSQTLGGERRKVRVYLPPSYDLPDSAGKRYPVIYLLHGWPGGEGNWPGRGRAAQTLDSLIARGAIPEVIAVMPSGSGAGFFGRSLYLNSYDGRCRIEDYMVNDVVDWVDSTFRTRADAAHRALIGLSEGASAALNLTFKHPDRFGACGGHSGQYLLQRDFGMRGVWGSDSTSVRIRLANSPRAYAATIVQTLRQQVIYFDCGLGDGELDDNRALHRELENLGVPHTYDEFPGHHGWGYWKKHLRESLIACTARMW